jgi:hypothetical protein
VTTIISRRGKIVIFLVRRIFIYLGVFLILYQQGRREDTCTACGSGSVDGALRKKKTVGEALPALLSSIPDAAIITMETSKRNKEVESKRIYSKFRNLPLFDAEPVHFVAKRFEYEGPPTPHVLSR